MEDIKKYFCQIEVFKGGIFQAYDKGHGRLERGVCTLTDDIEILKKRHEWPGLKTIVRLETTVEKKAKSSKCTRYFISRLDPNAAQHLDLTGTPWEIENNLHCVLDCSFNEDRACVRLENAAINLLTSLKNKHSLKNMQRKC